MSPLVLEGYPMELDSGTKSHRSRQRRDRRGKNTKVTEADIEESMKEVNKMSPEEIAKHILPHRPLEPGAKHTRTRSETVPIQVCFFFNRL